VAPEVAPEAVVPEAVVPEAMAPEAPIGATEAVSETPPITEAPAIVEAPEPSAPPVEGVPEEPRPLAGPLKEAPAPRRTFAQAEAEGPILRDYNQATIDRYAGIYTALKSRLSGKVPKDVEVKLEELIGTDRNLLIRGQARVEKTPNGIKSVVDLSTGILRPDMTVEQAVEELAETLNHEIIHVLRDQGVIRPAEWKILSRAAVKTKVPGRSYTYLDKAQTIYTPGGRPISELYTDPDAVIEEAVAEMYKDWVKNKNAAELGKNADGQNSRGLFNRITEFFRSIFRVLKSNKYQEIFKGIDTGEIGAREGVGREASTRFSAGPIAPTLMAGIQDPAGNVDIRPFPDVNEGSSSVYLRRDFAKTKTKGRVRDKSWGEAFDKAFLQRLGRQFDINDPIDYKHIVASISDEIKHQMQQVQSGVGWYDSDIQDVFDELAKSFPILKDPAEGPVYRQIFTLIAGVMSNGMKAKANVELAAINFAHFLRTGQFSPIHPFTNKGWNQRSNIMGPQIAMLNSMVADAQFEPRSGSNNPELERYENFLRFMFNDHSVREINQFRARHGTKSPAKIGKLDDRRLGMYAFGPKFGPFILNLNGLSDETVDSWASRSFYRHMGRAIGADGELIQAPFGKDREAMKRALRDIAAATSLSSRDIQAVLWFYEKELFNQLGQKIPLEVFSDGAREFTRKYGTGTSGSVESRTNREREISGAIEAAGTRYSPPVERTAGRFSASPISPPDERVKLLKESQWGRYFDGPFVDEELRNMGDEKSRTTLVAMSPDDFLRMATHGLRNPGQEGVYAESIDRGMKLAELPRLHIKTYPNGETVITGHEGRHRAAAFKKLGFTKIPVIFRHDTYRWGLKEGRVPEPGSVVTGQAPMEHEMPMPDSMIFPLTERGTTDLNELLQQGEPLTNVSIGLAPAESSLEPKAREAIKQDSFYGGRKNTKAELKELAQRMIPKGITLVTKPIEEAARKAGAVRVYNSSAMGVYGGTAIEPSSAIEAIIPSKDGYTVANAMAEETFKIAKAEQQSDAFVALRLDTNEWSEPYARPGITLYFYPRASGPTVRSLSEVKEIINRLPSADLIGGYTAIASQKATDSRLGIEEGYEAIRFIWVPEYAGVKPEDVVQNWGDTAEALNKIAAFAEDNKIASANIDYYVLSLASKENYDERIKEHGKLRAGGNAQGSGGKGPWRRSVGESVAERAGQEASRVSGYSLNLPGGVKRFSAAPLPPYIEAKNRTLFVPERKESIVQSIFDFFSAPETQAKTLNTVYGQIDMKGGYFGTRAAINRRMALVDQDAYVDWMEKTLNEKETGNFQRREANQSAIVALGMARRRSQLTASSVMLGAPTIEFTRPGDIQSATVAVRKDADKLIDIFRVMLQPGPVDPATNEPRDKRTIFKTYATAMRAIGLKAAGKPVPRELDDTYINTTIQFTQQNYPEIVEAYKSYQRFNKKLLTAARDAGRITNAELAKFTQQMDYYGFNREVYEEQLLPGAPSRLAGDIKIREYKGSQDGKLIEDPMLVILSNVDFWMGAITHNIAVNKAFKLAKDMGEARLLGASEKPDLSRGESEQVMFFRENGILKRFAVKDPMLVMSLGSDDRIDMGKAMSLMGMPTSAIRETITRDPAFMVANLLRDTLSSWITSGENITPFIGTIKGAASALKGSASFQALMGRGVVGSHDLAMRSPAEMAAIIRRRAMPKNILNIGGPGGAQNMVMSLWDKLGVWSEASDAATRIAVYEAAIKNGMSEAEAAFRAIEIMNFSRRGSSGLLKILTQLIPFLNARIQGMDVLYQAGKAGILTAGGYRLGERDANLGKQFLVRGAMLAGISLALEFMLEDDEDYKELPDYVKNSNLLIPLKWFGVEGGYFAAVPNPFEAGLLFSTIPRELYKAAKGETSAREGAKFFWEELVSTFGLNPIPQIASPIAEIYFNMDMYTGLPLISEGKMRLTPELQYDSRTSTVARMLGDIPISYNFTTGKFEGVSPIVIDQLVSGYGGPMGSYIMQGVGMLMEGMDAGPERLPRDITQLPMIKRFLLDAESRSPKSVAQAYELFRVVDEVNRSFSRLRQTGDTEAVMDYLAENKDVLSYKKYIYKLFDGLNKISARERQIERDETMTRDEKFEAMNKLREVRARLTSQISEINKKLGR
jgi:hypothetical protein